MATISLCMIVKNEEKVLARCLDSVKPAVDEIVILDTGVRTPPKTSPPAIRTGSMISPGWMIFPPPAMPALPRPA